MGPTVVVPLEAALSVSLAATIGLAAALGHRRRGRKGLLGHAAGEAEARFGRYRGSRRALSQPAPSAGPPESEQRLRELMRARAFDRRGYIRVLPGEFLGITQQRAAQIAREEGLRAEAYGNRGSWRFGERVVEEVE